LRFRVLVIYFTSEDITRSQTQDVYDMPVCYDQSIIM